MISLYFGSELAPNTRPLNSDRQNAPFFPNHYRVRTLTLSRNSGAKILYQNSKNAPMQTTIPYELIPSQELVSNDMKEKKPKKRALRAPIQSGKESLPADAISLPSKILSIGWSLIIITLYRITLPNKIEILTFTEFLKYVGGFMNTISNDPQNQAVLFNSKSHFKDK
ncbi:hypothetical protein NPIL_123301 [Nephila pilipes]|uniref:Uncharacterized protein n=1 Tax=Nephila pilipes TaxID=299642 RepID=A0A8X6M800_NEPPI|nr:hypothetical protein NPIL_123301 [Nephila pilipes]